MNIHDPIPVIKKLVKQYALYKVMLEDDLFIRFRRRMVEYVLEQAVERQWSARDTSKFKLMGRAISKELFKKCTLCCPRWKKKYKVAEPCPKCGGTKKYVPVQAERAVLMKMSKTAFNKTWRVRWEYIIEQLMMEYELLQKGLYDNGKRKK